MEVPPKIDHALIVQWIFGMLVVVMYARDRFESPEPRRGTTTFMRYWLARIGYLLSMLAIFLVLGGAVTAIDPKWLLQILGGEEVAKDLGALPGPLLSALLLTSLLPHFPYLSKVDNVVKDWFQRVGNIPSEVRRLSACLQAADFAVPASQWGRIAPLLRQQGIESAWFTADPTSLQARWARTAAIHMAVEAWAQTRGYHRYLVERAAEYRAIKDRFSSLQLALAGPALIELDVAANLPLPNHLRRAISTDIEDLHQKLCDFVAGAVLHGEWNTAHRQAALKQIGFAELDEQRGALSINDVVLVTGLIFLGMLLITLIGRRFFQPTPLPPNMRVLVMVPIIYAIAIVLAIHPKSTWPFADIRAMRSRPVAAYAASGVFAAVASFLISLLFRFLFDSPGNLFEALSTPGAFTKALSVTLQRWPWLLMTFFATVSIAWAADDHALEVGDPPAWLRWAEAGGLATVFGVMHWVVLQLLSSSGAPGHWTPAAGGALGSILTSVLVGGCIGYLMPHLYRKSATKAREWRPARKADAVQAAQIVAIT